MVPDPLVDVPQPATHNTQTVVLAGGCFWCVEAVFDDLKGVVSVESGYSGGHTGLYLRFLRWFFFSFGCCCWLSFHKHLALDINPHLIYCRFIKNRRFINCCFNSYFTTFSVYWLNK